MIRSIALLVVTVAGFSLADGEEVVAQASPAKAVQYRDVDRDGIPDYLDPCPAHSNIGPDDRDGDRLIDSCDLDPAGKGLFRR